MNALQPSCPGRHEKRIDDQQPPTLDAGSVSRNKMQRTPPECVLPSFLIICEEFGHQRMRLLEIAVTRTFRTSARRPF